MRRRHVTCIRVFSDFRSKGFSALPMTNACQFAPRKNFGEGRGRWRVGIHKVTRDTYKGILGSKSPYVGGWTGEGVLLEVQMHDGRHEAQLDRKHGDPIAAEVQKGQLQIRDL